MRAVLALVPAVRIFVAIAGALPAGINVVGSKAQLKEKKASIKVAIAPSNNSFVKSK